MNNDQYRCESCSANHSEAFETCNVCGHPKSVSDPANGWLNASTIILTLLSFALGFCLFLSLHGGVIQFFRGY